MKKYKDFIKFKKINNKINISNDTKKSIIDNKKKECYDKIKEKTSGLSNDISKIKLNKKKKE